MSYDVIQILKGVVSALETRQTLSARMCLFREVHETDIETLDRILGELKELRDKDEALDELRERKMDVEEDCQVLAEKLNKTSLDLLTSRRNVDLLEEENKRLYKEIQEHNIGGLTSKEWNLLEIALDRHIDFGIKAGFQGAPGLCTLRDLQFKIRGRGEE